MHTPLVYTPDLIAPTYPFGIYEPGMTPDPLGCSSLPYHAADADEHEEGLIPAKTGDEVLEAETGNKALKAEMGDEALEAKTGDEVLKAEMGGEALKAELPIGALLDEADVCVAVAYEAGVWHELCRGGGQSAMGGAVMESVEVACGNGHGRAWYALCVCRSGEIVCLELEVITSAACCIGGTGWHQVKSVAQIEDSDSS
jgi:hypothetical protein